MTSLKGNPLRENEITVSLQISGIVQGVGFRPAVYRFALERGISGWIQNNGNGVSILASGNSEQIASFEKDILTGIPFPAKIDEIKKSRIFPHEKYSGFQIIASELSNSQTNAIIPPDLATCKDCLQDIFDPDNRRYLYPFTNCTNCGPRFSIIESIPYDRHRTTMKSFTMCPECNSEYSNPANRRFHAQPNACPECGPIVRLLDKRGREITRGNSAVKSTSDLLKQGEIIALKGIGGFQLLVDARNEEAVRKLRTRKMRPGKPFALMFPDIDQVAEVCILSDLEKSVLLSPQSPIVLLEQKQNDIIASNVAPNLSVLGAMLPYSPLHHILLSYFVNPIVATSGNLSDEPICIDESEALGSLSQIADFFLIHNRPILRPVDDSVTRIMNGKCRSIRIGRGLSPIVLNTGTPIIESLALGSQQKNVFAFSRREEIFVSQHIGDLDSLKTQELLQRSVLDLKGIWNFNPEKVIRDLHPTYFTTGLAPQYGTEVVQVQHHHAHILSCALENSISPPYFSICWDGTGFGSDGKIWGGEFFFVQADKIERFGHLREFPLPGGETAIKENFRIAIALLNQCGLLSSNAISPDLQSLPTFTQHFSLTKKALLILKMLEKKINCPLTSSMGRLFDGVSALLGICSETSFDGEAPMLLESRISGGSKEFYDFEIRTIPKENPMDPGPDFDPDFGPDIGSDIGSDIASKGEKFKRVQENEILINSETVNWQPKFSDIQNKYIIVDWHKIIHGIVADLKRNVEIGKISTKFHNSLATLALVMARLSGVKKVVFSGGCFQNRYLAEECARLLNDNGFETFWNEKIPTNDEGICVGQIAEGILRVFPSDQN
ncbi:MAG: carbamoyltransferase HypF [Candidatus Riflebacteria bacterium]|nr:carbamoyltransferase HypF [Candidatus Riflebacteria bacterium]